MAVYVKVEDLQDLKTALINLSKTLTDIDGNMAVALQRLHNSWQDEMYDDFKGTYDKYKQRVVEIAEQYEKFANGPLQETIDKLKIAEEKARKTNQ